MDRAELLRLLMKRTNSVRQFIASQIPDRFRALVSAEDVLQEVWIDAFRMNHESIDHLDAWLSRAARSKLIDTIRAMQTAKRGGQWHQMLPGATTKSYMAFFNRVQDGDGKTPSRNYTEQEAHGVFVTRQPRPKGTKLYGPFTSAAGVRDAVNALQRVFKFRTCELDIRADDAKRRFFRPCLLHAIKQCTAPCADIISKQSYGKDIKRLVRLLNSKRSVLMRQLNREMTAAAEQRDYEEAALLRDRIKAIQSLELSGNVDEHVQPEVFYVDPADGLEKLRKLLDLSETPRIVEGIDIATLQGESSVGSLVCFIDGKPFKNGYRRYKIKTVEGMDDYAMIREVIARRYRHAAAAEELYPDVILIDGGLGQLHAALEAFEHLRQALEADGHDAVRPAMVVSLAKREELVYVQAQSQPHKLPRNNTGLRLLQQVRDEAHRFGQHYHHILRRKRTFNEDVKAGRKPPQVARKCSSTTGRKMSRGTKADPIIEEDFTQMPPEKP